MAKVGEVRAARIAVVVALVSSMLTLGAAAAGAQIAGSVVINEVHYHTVADLDIDEFLELHNPGDTPVDISGMCFDGIDLCFAAGTTLAPGAFEVISPDAATTLDLYGVATLATWDAATKLSNKGEAITLYETSDKLNVVDQVAYDDDVPWPITPDGGGPSLELIDPTVDNNMAQSWAASTAESGTPGAVNSVFGANPNPITDVATNPASPTAADTVVVSASMPAAVSAELTYKVMFEAPVSVPMADDGASGDGAAGDGVYGATIPAHGEGELVRYRIDITSGGSGGFPALDDSIDYVGYVVEDTDITTSVDVLQWFLPDSDYEEMLDDHRFDDVEIPGVIHSNGIVYDNVTFRVRGGSGSRSKPKPPYRVEMPDGHLFSHPQLPNPVDQFNLQPETHKDVTRSRAWMGWLQWEDAGHPLVDQLWVRVERNADFEGLYRLSETLDGDWRAREGFDDGSFYKAIGGQGYEKKEPDDGDLTEIDELVAVLEDSASSTKADYLFANLDIPAAINWTAMTALTRHWDSYRNNHYLARDADSGRWTVLTWDLDLTYTNHGSRCSKSPMIYTDCTDNIISVSMMEVPEFREMHVRRLRTLADQILFTDFTETNYAALMAEIGDVVALDDEEWDVTWNTTRYPKNIDRRRDTINDAIDDGTIPGAASSSPQVVINEIHYNPINDGDEFIELYNPSSSEAVDLSGWTIAAAALEIAPGTVLLPDSYIVFVEDDAIFSASHPGRIFVGGEYSGGFSGGGELVELRTATGSLIDTVEYDDAAPWPIGPDGFGPSLELVDPDTDNAVAFAWGESKTANGTPGAQNDPAEQPIDIEPPTQPTNVTAVLGTGTTITVAWGASTDNSGSVEYDLYRDGAFLATTGTTSFNDGGVAEGAAATYTVVARDAAGNLSDESAPSAPPVGPPSVPPTVPGGLVLESASTTSVRFSWSPSTDNSGTVIYDIFRDGAFIGSEIATTYTDNTVLPDQLSIYTVEARDPSGNVSGASSPLEVTTPPGPTELIAFGDSWNYLDDGTDQGSEWRFTEFDDSSWGIGEAQLGYGDGDEATVIASGPAGDRYLTTYFRRSLELLDPSGLTDLTIELLRDDGAVVYVNGDEVIRSNMPDGAIDFDTRASAGVSGSQEDAAHLFVLDPAILRTGANVVAVEIHQRSSSSSDISFDLRLEVGGSFGPPDTEDPTQPTNVTAQLASGTAIDVQWNASSDNSGSVEYDVYRGGTLIAATPATAYTDTGVAEGDLATYTVVARDSAGNTSPESNPSSPPIGLPAEPPTDPSNLTLGNVTSAAVELSWSASTDNSGTVLYDIYRDGVNYDTTTVPAYTDAALTVGATYSYQVVARDVAGNFSGASNLVEATIPPPAGPVDFVVFGDQWSYLDDGSDQGSNWRDPSFDDSGWATGASKLGFGEGDEATVIDGGPRSNRKITTYFRSEFVVNGVGSYTSLEFELIRDDGAVIYVNGVELVRSNMPNGSVDFDTRAADGVSGSEEDQVFAFSVPADALVEGVNVIAVEVHQRGRRSSDLAFNLALRGIS